MYNQNTNHTAQTQYAARKKKLKTHNVCTPSSMKKKPADLYSRNRWEWNCCTNNNNKNLHTKKKPAKLFRKYKS